VTRRYVWLTDTTREQERFGAMAIIEKGGIGPHGEELHEHPRALQERAAEETKIIDERDFKCRKLSFLP